MIVQMRAFGGKLKGKVAKLESWVTERDALVAFGDRKARAILAVFMARRSAKRNEFFVARSIAERFGLGVRDLNWALDKLEGELVETVESRKGRFRVIRLTVDWGETVDAEKSKVLGREENPAVGDGMPNMELSPAARNVLLGFSVDT